MRFEVFTGVTVKNTVSKFTSILEEPAAIKLLEKTKAGFLKFLTGYMASHP